MTKAAGDVASRIAGRPQVLLGQMPKLLADLAIRALAELDLELVDDPSDLRPAGTGPPPIVIVAHEGGSSNAWTRDLLQMRPETIVLEVERDGRELAVRALYPSREPYGTFTACRLVDAIATATPWDERFLA